MGGIHVDLESYSGIGIPLLSHLQNSFERIEVGARCRKQGLKVPGNFKQDKETARLIGP
jgi:hypothetical protein